MIKEMREPTFLVLATLAEGKKHGYAIIQGVASLSEGEVELKAGTLYAMLDRLTFDGVIELVGEEIVDGRRSETALKGSSNRLRRLRFRGSFRRRQVPKGPRILLSSFPKAYRE